MLQSIEKTFDSAFFNANHSLRFMQKFITQINDGILAEDLGEQLGQLIQNVIEQLSVLAFCFAQLMCKTILFSENCYVIKVSFKILSFFMILFFFMMFCLGTSITITDGKFSS